MTSPWIGNWYERIKQRARGRGFATVTAFADTQPTASLLELADELGKDDVAAAQLEKVLLHEAEEAGTIERCARSLLVRMIHEELPEGWHKEWNDDTRFRRAGVFSRWVVDMGSRYEPIGDHICDVLEAAPIPEGWLPGGPDDPILVDIFQKHWHEPERAEPPGG